MPRSRSRSCTPGPSTVRMQDNQSTTSVNTLPFQEDFETQVNENMNPSRHSSSQDCKAPMPLTSPDEFEAQDQEFNEKMAMKDRHHLPPRFSTLFETKRPATPTREFESYPQQPPRKSGVCLPKPVFWALFAIFLFETAALFAYTVIGLMNNMPSKLIHTNSAGVVVSGCDCSPQPINISPNFFMPGASQAPVIETTTASVSTSTTASSTSSTSSSTSSTSSSSSSSESVKSGISELADIIKSAVPTSTSESSTVKGGTAVVTVTPPGPTIKSTVLLTVDPSGSTIAPPPTTTSIVWVTPTSTHETRDEPTSVEARDVPSSATSLASSGLSETPTGEDSKKSLLEATFELD